MDSRKENVTLYQDNAVELSDEALARVVGGWGDGEGGCDPDWDSDHDCGWRPCRSYGLLGDLLRDLL